MILLVAWFLVTLASVPFVLYLPTGTQRGASVMVVHGEETNAYHGQWDGAGGVWAVLRWLLFADWWGADAAFLGRHTSLRRWLLLYFRHGLTCSICLSFVTPFVVGLLAPISWAEYWLIGLAAAGSLGVLVALGVLPRVVLTSPQPSPDRSQTAVR